MSQMVLARVNNVKSGWQSMFMVFTTAAGDPDPNIVALAFKTVERIVREHFGHITGASCSLRVCCHWFGWGVRRSVLCGCVCSIGSST